LDCGSPSPAAPGRPGGSPGPRRCAGRPGTGRVPGAATPSAGGRGRTGASGPARQLLLGAAPPSSSGGAIGRVRPVPGIGTGGLQAPSTLLPPPPDPVTCLRRRGRGGRTARPAGRAAPPPGRSARVRHVPVRGTARVGPLGTAGARTLRAGTAGVRAGLREDRLEDE